MALLSIVIPVFNVQAYLEECLDSVLNQSFRDIQVIAVDDGSPDHSGSILDERARLDDRLTVIHLERNTGLGPARNRGLSAATGDYVLFLDSDDTLTAEALSAISRQLAATGWPEILLLDHARTYWWGKVQRNMRHTLLQDLSAAPFTAPEHPEIFELIHVAWNKVCRRDFLQREGLEFPTGYYEDTPWTYQALLTARSIATLPRVAVHYRQRRHGSILGTTSSRHTEAFDQWERVFGFLDSRPDLARWRSVAVDRMTRHYLTVLRHPGRLSEKDRVEFFRRASQHLRRFGAEPPRPFSRDAEATLRACLYRGDLRAFDALRRAKRGVTKAAVYRRGVTRTLQTARRKAGTAARRAAYRLQLHHALDPQLAVFASYWYRGVTGNPLAIHQAMGRLAPAMRGVWVVREDQVDTVPAGVDHVVAGTRRYWQLMARATYFVNDVNFPDDVRKRPGQVHIQTQHGTPLKHMGLDLMPHPAASKGMVFGTLLQRSDRWDYNLSANRFSTLVWERAFPSVFTSVESGYPRNDELVNATGDSVAEARASLGIPDSKTVVLYAPTHRDHDRHFTLRVDLESLTQELGPDFVVLVRAHYFYTWLPELAQLEHEGALLNVSQHPSVERLMLAADVLVTDYSSIMFDYANLDRPTVIYAPDWETYQEVRGVYFDLFAKPPGPVTTDQSTLAEVLISGKYDDPSSRATRASFRAEFCQFDDGRASERVVRSLMLGEALLPVIPLNERVRPPRPDEVHSPATGVRGKPTRRPVQTAMADVIAEVSERQADTVAAAEASELEVLEPDPGLAVAELVPTLAEDRAAVSWRRSGDPGSDYAPVPVTVDPERTPWRESAGKSV